MLRSALRSLPLRALPARALPARALPLFAVALFAAAAVLVPVGSARAAGDDVSWTVRTASNDLGADRTSFDWTVQPGSSLDDAMMVVNHGDQPLDLGVYSSDGFTTKSGGFDLLVAGAASHDVGVWVAPTQDRVTIAPGATAEVPFRVTVPRNATPGDYAGGIVTSLVRPDDGAQVNVDRRLGIRIALRVGGDLAPSLAVEHAGLQWSGGLNPFAGGSASLGYTLHNTGNAVLSARQETGVTGPFGWFPAKVKAADPPRLLPGETWRVRVGFPDVASAVWLAATAKVTPIVTDASGSTSAMTPVSVTATGWAVPWSLLVLVLLVAAAVVAAVLLLRRARARRSAQEDERVRDAVERALAEQGAS